MNSLMKLKKIELINLYENEQQRADEQSNRAECLQEELDEAQSALDLSNEDNLDLEEIRDLLNLIKIAKERDFLGVATAREDFENAFDKLLTYAN
jgi:hypothetical protein